MSIILKTFDSCNVKCIWILLTRCTSVLWPKTDTDEIAALLPYLASFFCDLNQKCLRCKSGEHVRGRNRFWYANTSMLQRKQRHSELRWSFVLLPNCVGWKAFFLPERHNLWRLEEEEEQRQMCPQTGLAARATTKTFLSVSRLVSVCKNHTVHQ